MAEYVYNHNALDYIYIEITMIVVFNAVYNVHAALLSWVLGFRVWGFRVRGSGFLTVATCFLCFTREDWAV